MKKLNQYLKIAEAATFLGVSQNTLRKWADTDQISVRVNPANGYRLFRREGLKKFLSSIDALGSKQRKQKG